MFADMEPAVGPADDGGGGDPAALIEYTELGVPAYIRAVQRATERHEGTRRVYRRQYAERYMSPDMARQFLEECPMQSDDEEDDDADEEDEEDAESDGGKMRRQERQYHRVFHPYADGVRVQTSDDFCMLCDTDPQEVLDENGNSVHDRVRDLVASMRRDNHAFERIFPHVYMMYNHLFRPRLPAACSTTHGGGPVRLPRWTVASIVRHFYEHVPHDDLRTEFDMYQARAVRDAIADRMIPREKVHGVDAQRVQAWLKVAQQVQQLGERSARARKRAARPSGGKT
jgi:hypothetical protein